jgi:hypothetical protein
MHAAIAPLLEAIRASHDQQEKINAAVLHLANAFREDIVTRTKPATAGRRQHRPTPIEKPLDEALQNLGDNGKDIWPPR